MITALIHEDLSFNYIETSGLETVFVLGLPTGRFGMLGSGSGFVLGRPTGRFGASGSGKGLVLGRPTGRLGSFGSGNGLVLGRPTGRFPLMVTVVAFSLAFISDERCNARFGRLLSGVLSLLRFNGSEFCWFAPLSPT